MKKFPNEFADLLNSKGKKILQNGHKIAISKFPRTQTPFELLTGIINEDVGLKCQRLLDATMYKNVRSVKVPIPPETITGMKQNYEELLPKTMRFKTAYFTSRASKSFRAARDIGLISMLESESFYEFAKIVTGFELHRKNSVQCILYESGDYAGPHNDHHPENENAQIGYVDIHLMFSNKYVSNQYLVSEQNGYLSKAYDITSNGAIAAYKLPFWHYTTPLLGKARNGKNGCCWVHTISRLSSYANESRFCR